MSKPINFTALSSLRPLTFMDRNGAALVIGGAFLCCVLLSIIDTIFDMLQLGVRVPLLAYVLPVVGAIGWLVWWVYTAKDDNRAQAIEQFAADNKLRYSSYHEGDFTREPGSLFRHGYDWRGAEVVEGKLHGLPYSLYEYFYTTGNGKNSIEHSVAVFAVDLPRAMPQVVIDSLVEGDSGTRSALPIDFDPSQRVTLEGDFSRYFTVYAPDRYGATAVNMLAPDVMLALLRHATVCDVEIVDSKLYFYWPGTLHSADDFKTVYTVVDEVVGELHRKLTTSNIDMVSSTEVVKSTAAPQQPPRLERVWKWRNIAYAAAAWWLLSSVPWQPAQWLTAVLGLVAIIGAPFYIAYVLMRQQRLTAEVRRNYKDRK